MPKYSLLDMTQRILSSTDGDEVNSIFDTVESEQVADIVERSFWTLVDNKFIPEHQTLLNINSPADSDRPTHLLLPTGVDKVCWIRYNTIKDGATDLNYNKISYISPEQFLQESFSLTSSDAGVMEVDENGTTILIRNDQAPTRWTSFDDEYMVFNSFDSDVDSVLQSNKTMVFGAVEPTWTKEDTFTPDIDSNMFTALLNDAISMAHLELKQQAHAKAEKNARTSRAKAQRYKRNFEEARDESYPNYGR